MDLSDGVNAAPDQTLAFYGVTAPIQIADGDIVDNGSNSWTLHNKIKTLKLLWYINAGIGVSGNFARCSRDRPEELF